MSRLAAAAGPAQILRREIKGNKMEMITRRSAAVGIGAVMLASLAAVTPLQGASQSSTSRTKPDRWSRSFASSTPSPQHYLSSRLKASESSNAVESFYYYQGKPVRLVVAGDALSASFDTSVSGAAAKRLVGGLSGSARVSPATRLRGRDVSTISLAGESKAGLDRLLATLRASQNVRYAYPVWVDPKRGGRLLLTDEVVVHLKRGLTLGGIKDTLTALGLSVSHKLSYGADEYVLRLIDPKRSDPLAVSQALFESGLVDWAEPNFVQELKKDYVPNDPLFPQQWHLQNTGQVPGVANADARLSGAWDVEKGSPAITIAVIDDGIEIDHPDLAANIFSNPGEKPNNHIDDDHNGYVDDVHGWNFVSNTNNVSPIGLGGDADNHGTAVAGVAAARGDNGIGVTGACPRCTILPVKIETNGIWATDVGISDAIGYASRMADVLSGSWGGTEPSAVIHFALQDALTNGRDGKGAPVFFASGNSASGIVPFKVTGLAPGTYRFRWTYSKDLADAHDVGADTAWLAWVRFPDGEVQNFESSGELPPGWSSGGSRGIPWSVVTDPAHSDEGRCWSNTAKAGTISNSEETYIEVVKTFEQEGDLSFLAFVSSELGEYHFTGSSSSYYTGLDGLRLWVDKGNDGTYEWSNRELFAGVPPTGLSYPAAYSQAIAVGASTSYDCRAPYSQFGPELGLVAPSSGSDLTQPIVTTDRTGWAGYTSGDYFASFGGTSSAAPFAAGVAGLVLSRNPGLTAAQVREILETSADKINPSLGAYDSSGHSDRFGYGRVNAQRALNSTPLPSSVAFSRSRFNVRKGGSPALITITRRGNLATPASVDFATFGSTARAAVDFGIVSKKIAFAPGESSKTVSIPIRKHNVPEPTRTLSLKLSNPSPGVVLSRPDKVALTIGGRGTGKLVLASLSRTIFTSNQAARVELHCHFSPPSVSFGYVLSIRRGTNWAIIREVGKTGSFKGSRMTTVGRLFAGKPVRRGSYRLRLIADSSSKTLAFRII